MASQKSLLRPGRISISTDSPLAHTSPSTESVTATMTLRPFISLTFPLSSRTLSTGVGLRKSTFNDAATKRGGAISPADGPDWRNFAAEAVAELWQSISDAIKPP